MSAICKIFSECFEAGAKLWVFGSRADLTKRGGDIDLYVETSIQPLQTAIEAKNAFHIKLIKSIGDQKIDIVINNASDSKLIYDIANTEGVQLL